MDYADKRHNDRYCMKIDQKDSEWNKEYWRRSCLDQ